MKSLLFPLIPLIAQAPHGMHPMASPILHHAKELGLSDAQVEKLKAQAEGRRDALRAAHEAFMQAMKALHEGGDHDAALAQIQTTAGNLRPLVKQAMEEDLAVLTPDQQAKFKTLKAEMGRGHHGHPGMMPPKD
jgi:Spy/CpxP family protein refolding chaperone